MLVPVAGLSAQIYAQGTRAEDGSEGQLGGMAMMALAFFVVSAVAVPLLDALSQRSARWSNSRPPGWYTDPGDRTVQRWWDGIGWRDATPSR